ncbi:MAG TPA: CDGSH iron-sulfur domain-containing protein [Stellaceae bacterium]|jgi:CDGSH-type Zn-finger protein|nr:CDGSH iron-sulfur domain-containing protein [Stellaceae bacterium]
MGEAIPARKSPFSFAAEAGKEYWWCACGRSRSQPLCDGSHRGTGLTPVSFKVERDGEVWLCGCKQTQGKPFCDGSHNQL